jgi:hypothetical protein
MTLGGASEPAANSEEGKAMRTRGVGQVLLYLVGYGLLITGLLLTAITLFGLISLADHPSDGAPPGVGFILGCIVLPLSALMVIAGLLIIRWARRQ